MAVGIVSFCHTRYGKVAEDIPTLLKTSIECTIASADHGIDSSEIDLLVISNVDNEFSNQHQIGTVALRYIGIPDAQTLRVEAACASGGIATYVAKQMIEAGVARNALVVGVEKMTHLPTALTTSILIRGGAPEEIESYKRSHLTWANSREDLEKTVSAVRIALKECKLRLKSRPTITAH